MRRRLSPRSWLIPLLTLAAAAALAAPAQASVIRGDGPPGSAAVASATAATVPFVVAPTAGAGPISPAAAQAAAATCVRYATRAGWANNGYFSGDLVTAAAICVAESAGDPLLYVCDENETVVGQGDYVSGQPVDCPGGTTSYDRGLWQLNSVNASGVSDACAFAAICDAGQAYLFSQRGTDFEPWSSYDQDTYAQFIDDAQAAVTKLTSGTVTSALLGECLAQAKSAANAAVVIVNCGSGGTTQQWTVTGGKLRSGSVCASIGSKGTNPLVVLRKCASAKSQQWAAYGRDQLRNAADGKCLTVPGSSLASGTKVDVTPCQSPAGGSKAQIWWLP